ncbi:SDR family oxidoreductase [Streptomyces alfalfae]|uniref:SDR family oxidoreductase n=1 Tax=Streptomyces alfalfae TaxID=1642299 RepID=UPI001BAD238A|nr:SDR family oxidoreductase [Streptomyces alfalfae]QUI34943.1 SDR family oxidoreductase [Streptomyces alfalfae]
MEASARPPDAPVCPPGHDLLVGRTAVITAAAGAGIGGATARRFLEEGARVVIGDAHPRRTQETVAALAAEFGADRVDGIPCDVTDEAQVRGLFDLAETRHGRLDIVVNNAGLGGTAQLTEMTDEEWDKVIDVTLTGTFRCTRTALRRLRAGAHGGVMVNNASVLGWRAQAGQAHYAAAKAGVMALTRCAAVEAAPHGIRVNAVAPSLAMHPHLAKVTSPELLKELTAREAFGRHAEPWEIANVIVFLAGGYSSYMTGETVSVSSQHA